MRKLVVVVMAICLLALSMVPAMAQGPVANYTCDGGKTFKASFDNTAKNVKIDFADGSSVTLDQQLVASGMNYATGTTIFTGKGQDAQIEQNGVVTYANCKAADQPAAEPAAKPATMPTTGASENALLVIVLAGALLFGLGLRLARPRGMTAR
jgi:membrane-bound inhibitor of C-type lysozyme